MGLLSKILRFFGFRLSPAEELELQRAANRRKAEQAQARREAEEDRRVAEWLRENLKRGRKY